MTELECPLIIYTDVDTSLCKAREQESTCPLVGSRHSQTDLTPAEPAVP
jgi:hypothetical protein